MNITLKNYLVKTEQTINIQTIEIDLLLSCSRTNINREIENQIINLVKQKVNWQKLLNLAKQHGLEPLLFQSLNQVCPEIVPKNILHDLQKSFQKNAGRNLLFTAELLKLLKTFKQQQIAAIPFKGAALAMAAYHNLALRKFSDLDILVQKKDMSKAQKILEQAGYQLADQFAETEEKPYVNYSVFNESERNQKDFTYINFQTKVVIELHWSLAEIGFPFHIEEKSLWKNNPTITLAGQKIRQFEAETMLVYLCFHSSKHHWEELRWLCDVAEFIQANPQIDWQLVKQKAQKWGCDRMVNLGLILAHKLLKLNLPQNIIKSIEQDREAINLSQKLTSIILGDQSIQKYSYLSRCLLLIRYRERFQDKIRCFSHIAFTPTFREWNMIQLPQSLSFMYYLIRPYRLLLEYFGIVDEPEEAKALS